MARYAHVVNGKVVNVIEYDGVAPFDLDEGELVLDADMKAQPGGGTYEGKQFIAAVVPDVVETLVDASPRPTVQDIDNALAVIATEPALTQDAKDAITAIARAATRGIAPDA